MRKGRTAWDVFAYGVMGWSVTGWLIRLVSGEGWDVPWPAIAVGTLAGSAWCLAWVFDDWQGDWTGVWHRSHRYDIGVQHGEYRTLEEWYEGLFEEDRAEAILRNLGVRHGGTASGYVHGRYIPLDHTWSNSG